MCLSTYPPLQIRRFGAENLLAESWKLLVTLQLGLPTKILEAAIGRVPNLEIHPEPPLLLLLLLLLALLLVWWDKLTRLQRWEVTTCKERELDLLALDLLAALLMLQRTLGVLLQCKQILVQKEDLQHLLLLCLCLIWCRGSCQQGKP
jgi:hypothetical protein